MIRPEDLLRPTPQGLYCPRGDFYIDPVRSGLGAIGHMGYFRRQAEPLWRDVLGWFGEHDGAALRQFPGHTAPVAAS